MHNVGQTRAKDLVVSVVLGHRLARLQKELAPKLGLRRAVSSPIAALRVARRGAAWRRGRIPAAWGLVREVGALRGRESQMTLGEFSEGRWEMNLEKRPGCRLAAKKRVPAILAGHGPNGQKDSESPMCVQHPFAVGTKIDIYSILPFKQRVSWDCSHCTSQAEKTQVEVL